MFLPISLNVAVLRMRSLRCRETEHRVRHDASLVDTFTVMGTETARRASYFTECGPKADGTLSQSARHIWQCAGIEKLAW